MSNQQSVRARSSPTQTWIALGKLVATYNFAASPFLHYMISTQNHSIDPASWWLSQSCDSYAAAFCCRDVGPNGPNNKHSLEEHLWHVASTTSTVAPFRVARLGWLPSKAKLPKCQFNNQKSQSIANTNLDRLGKTGRYLQLRSFTFFALHDLYSEPFWTLLAGGCPKAVILTQLPFAVEMWAQMGQTTNTAWKNTCGTLPVQLQQWHPCEWQD